MTFCGYYKFIMKLHKTWSKTFYKIQYRNILRFIFDQYEKGITNVLKNTRNWLNKFYENNSSGLVVSSLNRIPRGWSDSDPSKCTRKVLVIPLLRRRTWIWKTQYRKVEKDQKGHSRGGSGVGVRLCSSNDLHLYLKDRIL